VEVEVHLAMVAVVVPVGFLLEQILQLQEVRLV
jgi:hypothetical protein